MIWLPRFSEILKIRFDNNQFDTFFRIWGWQLGFPLFWSDFYLKKILTLSQTRLPRAVPQNQPPRLPVTALNVMKPAWCGGGGGFFLTNNNTIPTKVV
jgi:hypothetical protein